MRIFKKVINLTITFILLIASLAGWIISLFTNDPQNEMY